ncbi:MAG: helix-turn-helix transcriptional regulator [Phycisphaerales bacterium]
MRAVSAVDPSVSFAQALGADVAWNALLRDSGADVAIVDASGKVRFCGPTIRWWSIGADPVQVVGRSLSDLLGHEMAEERLGFIRRALAEGVPVTVYSVVRGMRIRTIYRPVEGVEGTERLVLAIGRPADDVFSDPALQIGQGLVLHAKVVDMGPLASLTPREMEVLRLIGQGLSTAQIAKSLNRSVKTIEAHRLSLGLKLKARNRVDLARLALRAGLTLDNDANGAPPPPPPNPADTRKTGPWPAP